MDAVDDFIFVTEDVERYERQTKTLKVLKNFPHVPSMDRFSQNKLKLVSKVKEILINHISFMLANRTESKETQ